MGTLPRLYSELTGWYRLVDPLEDHLDEATVYADALARAISGPATTLLELGSGAGHNAFYMKQRFTCTLSDLSAEMLALSREINAECEHVLGDMRTLRLERQFDAVFVHDAIAYLTTRDDLRRAAETAFVHTRPGGAALFAPDYVRERFRDSTQLLSADRGARSLRGLEWSWDPDPADSIYRVEYVFVLRDDKDVATVHDRHVEGLFSREEWCTTLESVGYHVSMIDRPLDGDGQTDEVFICVRELTPSASTRAD